MLAPTMESQTVLTSFQVEKMSHRANQLGDADRLSAVEKAMRIVCDREPRTMRVLEQAANIMGKINEQQHGETQRQSRHVGTSKGVQATETSLWQEAYRLADAGKPSIHFGWLYAAAAERAGHHVA